MLWQSRSYPQLIGTIGGGSSARFPVPFWSCSLVRRRAASRRAASTWWCSTPGTFMARWSSRRGAAVHRDRRFQSGTQTAECASCGSTRFRVGGGMVVCFSCGEPIINKTSKYYNVRQTYAGVNYDSKFEATVAASLDLRKL